MEMEAEALIGELIELIQQNPSDENRIKILEQACDSNTKIALHHLSSQDLAKLYNSIQTRFPAQQHNVTLNLVNDNWVIRTMMERHTLMLLRLMMLAESGNDPEIATKLGLSVRSKKTQRNE